jgi:hypothetical protein
MGVLESNRITKTDFSANGQTLVLDVANLNTVRFEFVGTYAFTGAFEALGIDGVTWYPFMVAMVHIAGTTLSHSTANATQAYEGNCSAVSKVRIRLTAFTSAGTHSVGIAATESAIDPATVAVLAAGTASIGTVILGAGTASVGTVATPAGTAISVVSAATTNASSQKATAGNLFEVSVSNPTATPAYVKFYNKATAPTVGTDVPVLTIVAPATSATQIPTAINLTFSQIGKRFSNGIAMAITGGALATDTAVAVAGVQVHGTYI